MSDHPIVLFDGICNYCNDMVDFAIRNDPKAILRFAPLQSDMGKKLLEEFKVPSHIDSVIMIEKGKAFTYSNAALHIIRHLRWPTKALYGLVIVPPFIRQPFYRWVAKNRYKWYGKRKNCRIPTAEVRARFLE